MLHGKLSGQAIFEAAKPLPLEEGSLSRRQCRERSVVSCSSSTCDEVDMVLSHCASLDINCAANIFAKHITCWRANDDRRSARLVGYLSTTVGRARIMIINEPLDELHIALSLFLSGAFFFRRLTTLGTVASHPPSYDSQKLRG